VLNHDHDTNRSVEEDITHHVTIHKLEVKSDVDEVKEATKPKFNFDELEEMSDMMDEDLDDEYEDEVNELEEDEIGIIKIK